MTRRQRVMLTIMTHFLWVVIVSPGYDDVAGWCTLDHYGTGEGSGDDGVGYGDICVPDTARVEW